MEQSNVIFDSGLLIFLLTQNYIIIRRLQFNSYISISNFIFLKGLYIVYILQFAYQNPRPYWNDSQITTFYCDGSFVVPDDFLFTLFFLNSYMIYCYERTHLINFELDDFSMRESSEENESRINTFTSKRKKIKIYKILSWTIISMVMFFRYVTGLIYLDSIFITFIYFLFYYEILLFMEDYYDQFIRSSVLEVFSAKRMLFLWMIILILLQFLALIIYLISERFVLLDWAENYVKTNKFI